MRSLKFISAITVAILLAACGGGGSGGSSRAQTGTATMTISDAPVDGYSKIIMTVSEIRFIGAGGQDILVLDEPKQIDFLALSNFSEVLTKREVVAGTYNKIRLILDSLTLVKTDSSGNETSTDVPLQGLQKVDINPQGTFEVHAGEDIVIHVDLDLNRSIHIVQAGASNRVNFRPVIFATITAQPAFDKLFRVEGTIESIDTTASTLNVCDIRHVSDDGSHMPNPMDVCVFTDPNSSANYFDTDSMPDSAGFGGLAANDQVVMYGKFDPNATKDTFVPAVIARGSRDTFARERGISSAFNSTTNSINLDEASPVCIVNPPQREVDVASEAAVFSEDVAGAATRIDRTAIANCDATEAEGTSVTTPSSFLRSFALIQGQPVVAGEELDGSLTLVSGSQYSLAPTGGGTNQCVITNSSTQITQIALVSNVPTVSHPTTVPTGIADVAVFGIRDSNDCLVASQIVDDQTGP